MSDKSLHDRRKNKKLLQIWMRQLSDLWLRVNPRTPDFNVGATVISVMQTFVRRILVKTQSKNFANIEIGGAGVIVST